MQKKLPLINSAHGSETRNIINELIKLFNGLGYTYDEALYQAKIILNEAKKTNNINKDVQQQINTLIAESGTSDAEVVQARIDFKGKEYPVIKERIDKSEYHYNRDFKKRNSAKIPNTNLNTSKTVTALNTFIDDDGHPAILTKLKPLSEKYDVPFVVALIGETMERGSGLTVDQSLDLQNRLGWEITSHEYNHLAMNNVTDPEIIDTEIRYSQEYFRDKGLDVKNIVYPFGQHNKSVKDAASRFYNCGVGTQEGTNKMPIRTYNLRRIAFPHDAANKNIAYYKNIVDEAIENKEWLIWMLHCGQDVHDSQNQQILDDLIAYMNSKNLDTVTLQEGLERYGNVFSTDDEKLYVSADGTNNIANHMFLPVNQSTGLPQVNGEMLPSDFELMKTVTSIILGTATRATMPVDKNGVLTTTVGEMSTYAYQIYAVTDQIFYRYARGASNWYDWQELSFKGQELSFKKDNLILKSAARSIQPNTAARIPIENGGILKSDINTMNPSSTLPGTALWSYTVHGNGIIYLHVYNSSTVVYEMPETEWTLTRRT